MILLDHVGQQMDGHSTSSIEAGQLFSWSFVGLQIHPTHPPTHRRSCFTGVSFYAGHVPAQRCEVSLPRGKVSGRNPFSWPLGIAAPKGWKVTLRAAIPSLLPLEMGVLPT